MKKIVMSSLLLSGTFFAQNAVEVCTTFDNSSRNTKGR